MTKDIGLLPSCFVEYDKTQGKSDLAPEVILLTFVEVVRSFL